MAVGELVTVPLPEFVTVRKNEGSRSKVAVMGLSVVIVTMH
jgi:hypothetical protein